MNEGDRNSLKEKVGQTVKTILEKDQLQPAGDITSEITYAGVGSVNVDVTIDETGKGSETAKKILKALDARATGLGEMLAATVGYCARAEIKTGKKIWCLVRASSHKLIRGQCHRRG